MPGNVHVTGRRHRGKVQTDGGERRDQGQRGPAGQQSQPGTERTVAEIWQRLLKRTDIGMDDDFFEIGGDSLQATEMLLELEETTRHRINPSDVRAQLTIRLLCDKLASVAAAKKEVMTKVRSGHGTPLFLCHGDYCGWGFYAFRLSERLKGDGPVYLLHSVLDKADELYKTFGDGSVQKLMELKDGSALILSIAKYYSPAGKAIQDNAVTPNVLAADVDEDAAVPDEDENAVPSDEVKKPTSQQDEQLDKAIQVLKSHTS